jgi:hypothetical protein
MHDTTTPVEISSVHMPIAYIREYRIPSVHAEQRATKLFFKHRCLYFIKEVSSLVYMRS